MSFWGRLKDRLAFPMYSEKRYPKQKYLTVVSGIVYGPVRWECPETLEEKFVLPENGKYTTFTNQGPVVDENGKTWEVSVIQKKSWFGHLVTDPGCCYEWDMRHLQQQDSQGNWIPGTEYGKFKRQGFNWRRDLRGTFLFGQVRHWVFTFGYEGTHFD